VRAVDGGLFVLQVLTSHALPVRLVHRRIQYTFRASVTTIPGGGEHFSVGQADWSDLEQSNPHNEKERRWKTWPANSRILTDRSTGIARRIFFIPRPALLHRLTRVHLAARGEQILSVKGLCTTQEQRHLSGTESGFGRNFLQGRFSAAAFPAERRSQGLLHYIIDTARRHTAPRLASPARQS